MTVKFTSEGLGKELVEDAFVVVSYGRENVYVAADRKAMAVDWSDQTYYEADMGINTGPAPAVTSWTDRAKSKTANNTVDMVSADLMGRSAGVRVGRLEAKINIEPEVIIPSRKRSERPAPIRDLDTKREISLEDD